MTHFKLTTAALVLLALMFPLQAIANSPARDALSQAKAECAALENGVLTVEADAITSVDLTGDGAADEILDYSKISCSTALTYWCGSGGCAVGFYANGAKLEIAARNWTVINWSETPILLTSLHGTGCGDTGANPCYKAFFWFDGTFRAAE